MTAVISSETPTPGERPQVSRRPVRVRSQPEPLGAALTDLLAESGLTQIRLAGLSGTSARWWRRVRDGAVTRRSTLAAWVAVMVDASADLGPADELVDRLCTMAGPDGLADESQYAERVLRRRDRRARRYVNREAWAERAAAHADSLPRPEGRAAVRAARVGDLATVNEMLTRLQEARCPKSTT